MSHRSSRRQFLRGRSSAQRPRSPADGGLLSSPDRLETSDPGTYVLEVGRRAMACEFQVMLNAGQYSQGTEAALEVLDRLEILEQQLSAYRPHSEINRLNARAATAPQPVELGLFQLLELARELFAQTQGAFDITSSPLSKLWGFHRREGRLPTAEEIEATLPLVGMQHVRLDPKHQTIQFLRDGIELNLGSIGKGYALDRSADYLASEGIQDFLIHGGHSSILARGRRRSGRAGAAGWVIAVRDPYRPERKLGELCLLDRAVGTSGLANQSFIHQGRRYGHVLDPRTGYPADQLLSTTVLAPTGALADALATALFVLGPAEARAYCESHPEAAALLVLPGAGQGLPIVETIGLSADEWRAAV